MVAKEAGRVRLVKRVMLYAGLGLLFLLGVLGHLLTAPSNQDSHPIRMTVCVSGADNALAEALSPETLYGTDGWRVGGKAASLLSFSKAASLKEGYADGRYIRYPSALTSDLTLVLLVYGHTRGESIYLEDLYLAVGREITVTSPALSVTGRITALLEAEE